MRVAFLDAAGAATRPGSRSSKNSQRRCAPTGRVKEFIREDERNRLLREQSVENVSQTSRVFVEGDGKIRGMKRDQKRCNPPERKGL